MVLSLFQLLFNTSKLDDGTGSRLTLAAADFHEFVLEDCRLIAPYHLVPNNRAEEESRGTLTILALFCMHQSVIVNALYSFSLTPRLYIRLPYVVVQTYQQCKRRSLSLPAAGSTAGCSAADGAVPRGGPPPGGGV